MVLKKENMRICSEKALPVWGELFWLSLKISHNIGINQKIHTERKSFHFFSHNIGVRQVNNL